MSYERNIWQPDPDPVKAAHEQAWWQLGRDYLYALHVDVHHVLALPKVPRRYIEAIYRAPVGSVIAKADTTLQTQARDRAYQNALDRHRDLAHANRLEPEYASEIGGLLTDYWYARSLLRTRAEARAVRTWLSSYIRENPAAPRPAEPPAAWHNAQMTYELEQPAANSMRWAQSHAAEHVTAMSDDARHRIAQVVLDSMQEGRSSEATARVLLDHMGSMNRDWRRIALTEMHSNYSNGMLAALIGEEVEWLAARDACPHCRQYHQRRFRVLEPTDPDRDFHKHVWPGKTNVGRSFSPRTRDGRERTKDELAGPAIPAHPHCRCSWGRVLRKIKADPRLEAYLKTLGGHR